MKRIFAVALLLISFASVALADGGGQIPPPSSATLPAGTMVADGGGQIPPPARIIVADGGGQIPPPARAKTQANAAA
jgi:hypothetical protein